MRILQAFSSIAFGSGTPSPKLRDQRRLRSVAGPPGEFLTVLPCGRGHVRVGSSCSAPPRRTVFRQSGSPPPLSRQGRPGFPVRMGCSRLPKKPRCILALQIFDVPLAVAIFRLLVSWPEDHVRLRSPGGPLPASGSELISEALLPVGEPTLWKRTNLLRRTWAVTTGDFRASPKNGPREPRCCRLASLLTQRMDSIFTNQKKSTFRNPHCIHNRYQQLWIAHRRHASALCAGQMYISGEDRTESGPEKAEAHCGRQRRWKGPAAFRVHLQPRLSRHGIKHWDLKDVLI